MYQRTRLQSSSQSTLTHLPLESLIPCCMTCFSNSSSSVGMTDIETWLQILLCISRRRIGIRILRTEIAE